MKSLEEIIKPFVNILLIVAFLVFAVSWGFWKFQNSNKGDVTYLQITTAAPPTGKRLLPEQRRIFALEFGKKFKDKGKDAIVTTTGDFHTTILIQGDLINEALVHEMKDNVDIMQGLREMGFKHLVMTGDKVSWDIDLKN